MQKEKQAFSILLLKKCYNSNILEDETKTVVHNVSRTTKYYSLFYRYVYLNYLMLDPFFHSPRKSLVKKDECIIKLLWEIRQDYLCRFYICVNKSFDPFHTSRTD